MNSILDFLQGAASAEPAAYGYGLAYPLAQTTVPKSLHYNAHAPGIAGLLGQVDENLIQNAMAERASGHHTLH